MVNQINDIVLDGGIEHFEYDFIKNNLTFTLKEDFNDNVYNLVFENIVFYQFYGHTDNSNSALSKLFGENVDNLFHKSSTQKNSDLYKKFKNLEPTDVFFTNNKVNKYTFTSSFGVTGFIIAKNIKLENI